MEQEFHGVIAEWNKLGQIFYKRHEVYSLDWDVCIDACRWAGASKGGPIALMAADVEVARRCTKVGEALFDPTRTQSHSLSQSPALVLRVFDAAGKLLGSTRWPGKGQPVDFGWTQKDVLLCIDEDGQVFSYSVHARYTRQPFYISREIVEEGIDAVKFLSSGLVVLTHKRHLYVVTFSLNGVKTCCLSSTELTSPVSSLAAFEPQSAVQGQIEVLLALCDRVVKFNLDGTENTVLQSTPGPYLKLSISPNGQLLAAFTTDGKLRVLSTDLVTNFSEFDTRSSVAPEQLVWCGVDAVVLYWPEIVLMVGPFGDWIKYTYDEAAIILPEIDGASIITRKRREFLRRIPDALVDIFAIGSTVPAAMLYDRFNNFGYGRVYPDETQQLTGTGLVQAIDGCISAAGHELDVVIQRRLMRAAAHGASLLSKTDETFSIWSYSNMCCLLRVLNSMRTREVGMPMTYMQFLSSGNESLVERLLAAHHHLLAIRITDMLGLGKQHALHAWALAKMATMTDIPDSAMVELIHEKMLACPGISYALVAREAHQRGRPRLARALLDYEPCAAQQVPMMKHIGEHDYALTKAIESRDADLVCLTVLDLKAQTKFQEFVTLLNEYPQARALFVAFCRRTECETLKSLYCSMGDTLSGAEAMLHQAYSRNSDGCINGDLSEYPVVHSAKCLEQVGMMFDHGKDAFSSKTLNEGAKLFHAQMQLSMDRNGMPHVVGTSLCDTLYILIKYNKWKEVQHFRSEFKISDRHFAWIKARSLAEQGNWAALDNLAHERKPPIGFLPFVELCQKYVSPRAELAKYITKLPDVAQRAELFAQSGFTREAQEASMIATQVSQSLASKAVVFLEGLKLGT